MGDEFNFLSYQLAIVPALHETKPNYVPFWEKNYSSCKNKCHVSQNIEVIMT